MKNTVRQSLYIPDDIYADMMCQCVRLDRNISWLIRRAWALARERIAEFPSVEDMERESLQ